MDEILITENIEDADMVCTNCIGVLHETEVQKMNRLFTEKRYVSVVLQCNMCAFKSKIYCKKINRNGN